MPWRLCLFFIIVDVRASGTSAAGAGNLHEWTASCGADVQYPLQAEKASRTVPEFRGHHELRRVPAAGSLMLIGIGEPRRGLYFHTPVARRFTCRYGCLHEMAAILIRNLPREPILRLFKLMSTCPSVAARCPGQIRGTTSMSSLWVSYSGPS